MDDIGGLYGYGVYTFNITAEGSDLRHGGVDVHFDLQVDPILLSSPIITQTGFANVVGDDITVTVGLSGYTRNPNRPFSSYSGVLKLTDGRGSSSSTTEQVFTEKDMQLNVTSKSFTFKNFGSSTHIKLSYSDDKFYVLAPTTTPVPSCARRVPPACCEHAARRQVARPCSSCLAQIGRAHV